MAPESPQGLFQNGIRTRFSSVRAAATASIGLFTLALLFAPLQAAALSCTTQAELSPADRDALLAAANPLAAAVASQNMDLLQSSLLPSVTGDWESLRGVAESAKSLLQGGQLQWRNGYLLDATDMKAPADAQFFCTNTDNSMTVTVNLHALPPGKYALVLGDFTGNPLTGQLGMILGFDTKWKLGGLFVREGALGGHDGVWYWSHAREEMKAKHTWAAWFDYDVARWLLLPVDFLSSPNLDKLNTEQLQMTAPSDSLPLTVASTAASDAGKSWKITGLRLDTTLHQPDLGLTYESTGLTDPTASRAEALGVMSGLLHTYPELRANFQGLWAYAEKDGKRTYAIEIPMHDIP
ncbi:hypothetical protein [Acidicapsa ligni]|uniref:hypothetical protein n=1 Tax=Acidicapsa ligni TaxID=542300 RepID=UPI0021E07F10|nr:hypothetical protein [Acidicapsa ligni]